MFVLYHSGTGHIQSKSSETRSGPRFFFSYRCILAAPEVSGFQLPFPGTIAYTEFLAAIMDHNIEERKDLALAAFRGFDLDGNGTITSMEMGRVIWRSVLPAIKR